MKTQGASQQSNGSSQGHQTYKSAAPKRSNRALLKLAEYSFYAIAGVLAFFSASPWIEVGHAIGSEIAATRLYNALIAVPFLGLVFAFLRWILINALGAGLWAIVNAVQIAPTLLAVPPIYAAIVDWLKAQKEPDSDNPQIAKYQKKISEWLLNVFKEIGKFSAIAYLIELVVNLAYFAPYEGGWSVFMKDMPLWDLDKILYVQFGLMVASICAVEILIRFVLAVWRIFRAVRG
ncbi:hypothetical protein [Leptolyngbya sp. FACHB-17]|uniref:hypothetical protein n=1 Tax=unclassified Leptolyngbya TaxID=2650499 RepID=UPI0016803E13|nr:hypothetical protein [Leptolyngbya sp. FACHB-17]MBD2079592.1 hypothetical protein [Leptolyngbya sp. FACHB-17]